MRRLRPGQDIGHGFVVAAARPGSEEVRADGSIVRHSPHYRAERRVGEARVNLEADSEAGLLERVATWAADRARRGAVS
jgi:hypothetical protein